MTDVLKDTTVIDPKGDAKMQDATEPTAADKKPTRNLYVGVHVEKKGPRFKDPVVQVGIAYGIDLDDIRVENFCFEYKDCEFEKECYDRFWSKPENQKNWKRIQDHCAKAREMNKKWSNLSDMTQELAEWKMFEAVWWSELPSIAKAHNAMIKLCSDNPEYDFGAINWHVQHELKRDFGIRYTNKGEYRSIDDFTECCRGLPDHIQREINKRADTLAPLTHWAPDDARHIVVHAMLTDQVIQEQREKQAKGD